MYNNVCKEYALLNSVKSKKIIGNILDNAKTMPYLCVTINQTLIKIIIMKVNKIYRAMMRNQVRAAIAAAIIGTAIIGCTAIKQQVTSAHYTAWDIYCAEYQVDNECPTEDQENYFLDAFVGSGECDSLSMVYNGYIINGLN